MDKDLSIPVLNLSGKPPSHPLVFPTLSQARAVSLHLMLFQGTEAIQNLAGPDIGSKTEMLLPSQDVFS
jgi:hypothetical protein